MIKSHVNTWLRQHSQVLGFTHQFVFGTYIDNELIRQAVHGGGVRAHGRGLSQLGDLGAIGLGFAGVGAIMLALEERSE